MKHSVRPAHCPRCDKPIASDALWQHKPGCECAECEAHCFQSRSGPTHCVEVDWRARALAAEADIRHVNDVVQTLADEASEARARALAAESLLAGWKPVVRAAITDLRQQEVLLAKGVHRVWSCAAIAAEALTPEQRKAAE